MVVLAAGFHPKCLQCRVGALSAQSQWQCPQCAGPAGQNDVGDMMAAEVKEEHVQSVCFVILCGRLIHELDAGMDIVAQNQAQSCCACISQVSRGVPKGRCSVVGWGAAAEARASQK